MSRALRPEEPATPAPLQAPGPSYRRLLTPLRIVLVYAAFGLTWILLSDRVLALFVRDELQREGLQTGKGIVFVLATAVLLHLLMSRNLAERRLREGEVRTVLDGMADGVLVTDREGRILDANTAAARLFGVSGRDALLGPVSELLQRAHVRLPDGAPLAFDVTATARALQGEIVHAHEARIRGADGVERLLSVSSAPVRAGSRERPRLAVAVLRDVTEERRFDELREEFLATAAHEFKTPLAVVKAYAQLMARRGQGDAAGLEVIARQIDRMTRMVQQLLEVSRFRLGGGELRREGFDLGELLVDVARELAPTAAGRRILVAPAPPAPVHADRERIVAVVANLVENALRFSPGGGDVEAAVARKGSEAVLSVRDHGLGIPPERQSRVFERYYRAHAGTAEDYGGLGVGLDVSREIVARHGGRIWFESAPGQGSTFFFSLPLSGEERADAGAEPAREAAP